MPAADRIKLRHLQGLVAVAENGSLVRAAAALSITQPAVSKMLAELEDIVGQRLVDRTRQGVVLTAPGRTLLRYAGSTLRTLREGLDSLARERAGDAPSLRIGALPNVAATVLPQALLGFTDAHPRARLQVRTGSNTQLIGLLRQGELDLVVGRLGEPSDMASLSFEQLYTEVLVFVVRPGHALARRRVLDPAVLARWRLVLPDPGTRVREAADRFFMTSGLGLPDPPVETIDVSFGRSFVLQSDAVWCVPSGAVAQELEAGRLIRLKIDTAVTAGPVGLTLRADRRPPAELDDLLAAIRRCAAAKTLGGG
jgi:LysR family pca operon transcriptional activator